MPCRRTSEAVVLPYVSEVMVSLAESEGISSSKARLDSIQTFSPDRRVGSSMTAGEMERFKYFANVIDDRRYGYHRAAAGLRSLVQMCSVLGPLGPEVDMATPCLLNVNPDRAPWVYPDRTPPFFSHLPDSSRHMKVQVRRQ